MRSHLTESYKKVAQLFNNSKKDERLNRHMFAEIEVITRFDEYQTPKERMRMAMTDIINYADERLREELGNEHYGFRKISRGISRKYRNNRLRIGA